MRYDSKPIGDSGLYRSGGYVYDEYLTELRGERGRRTFAEMIRGDAIIGGILFAIDMMIRRLEWRIDPASDDPEAHKWANRVDQAREDMGLTWVESISEASSFIPYGWAVMEITYKVCRGQARDPEQASRYDDGVISWARWGIRSQDTLMRWEFDDAGSPTAMVQMNPFIGQANVIPLDKCLHFKTVERKHNPEGVAAVRNAYTSWYFKKRIQQLEAIGIERNWVGIPMAKVPADWLSAGANEAQAGNVAIIKEIVTNLRNNEQAGIVWPSDIDENGNTITELTLLQTGGAPTVDTDRVIQRHNHDIARSLLAGFIFLADGAGSYALSVNQTGFFARALGAWVNHMCEVINKRAIAPMMRLNGVPEELWPVLNHGEVGEIDSAGMAESLLSLAQAGLVDVGDPDLREFVCNVFGLPAPVQSDAQEEEADGGGTTDATDQTAATNADGPIKKLQVKEMTRVPEDGKAKAAIEPSEVDAAMARFDSVFGKQRGLLNAEVAGRDG